MNGIAGFAMLYYTEALGLDYKLAGLALSISIFWDAITDPFMGHITDNTRSRFGRRHPYILIGGILSAVLFYFLWAVPEVFLNKHLLFWYLVGINLILRTAITIFVVPYGALGFEICTGYNDRSRLQGIRFGCGMAANMAGPALAWAVFFQNKDGIEGRTIASNYVDMGAAFAVGAMIFVFIVVFATGKYAVDSRFNKEIAGNKLSDFYRDISSILCDSRARIIFIFTGVVITGVVLVSSLQMYVYMHFMKFSSGQTSIVHGCGMVGAAAGALLSTSLSGKFDKKQTVFAGIILNIVCSIILAGIFVTGLLATDTVYNMHLFRDIAVPISMIVFIVFHSIYWMGNGIMMPLAASMMADISEINKYETGVLKDGSYAAMHSFIFKTAVSVGLFISGFCMDWTGFVAGSESQTDQAISNLAMVTFLGTIPVSLTALILILRYPVTREYMEGIKVKLAERENNKDE